MARSSYGKVLGWGLAIGAVAGAVSLFRGKAKASTLPASTRAPSVMPPAPVLAPPLVVAQPIRPAAPARTTPLAPSVKPTPQVVARPLPSSGGVGPGSGTVDIPYGGTRPSGGVAAPTVIVPAQPGGAMGVGGDANEVVGYAKRGEQTFAPDGDPLPAYKVSTKFKLNTKLALPGSTLPPLVDLSVVGYRWVDGAYRYVILTALSPTLYGFTEQAISGNLTSGAFQAVR
jgi:hypothetical protein